MSPPGVEERVLVVNADDFGLGPGINRGIVEAHEHGIVTSASLMVRWPAAAEAAAYARGHPRLGVGLHLDLGEWVFRDDHWQIQYQRADLEDTDAVATEVAAQLALFRELTGRDPSHIDSHQHVHLRASVLPAVLAAARPARIPVRGQTLGVRYCGAFYGQTAIGEPLPRAITVEGLVGVLSSVEAGVTELACHPGYAEGVDTSYGSERATEIGALCHADTISAVSRLSILLRSFRELAQQGWEPEMVDHSQRKT